MAPRRFSLKCHFPWITIRHYSKQPTSFLSSGKPAVVLKRSKPLISLQVLPSHSCSSRSLSIARTTVRLDAAQTSIPRSTNHSYTLSSTDFSPCSPGPSGSGSDIPTERQQDEIIRQGLRHSRNTTKIELGLWWRAVARIDRLARGEGDSQGETKGSNSAAIIKCGRCQRRC